MISADGTALLWCDECHHYHTKPMDCPYNYQSKEAQEDASKEYKEYGTIEERLANASAADILFEMAQERFGEYNG